MKKSSGSKKSPKEQNGPISEIKLLQQKAHPQIQAYILELEKEVARLRLVLAKQEVTNLSTSKKLKADFEARQKKAANLTVQFVSPNLTLSKT